MDARHLIKQRVRQVVATLDRAKISYHQFRVIICACGANPL